MSRCATPEQALAFVRREGVVLASATGAAPKLTEAIVGAAVEGSWWAHPESHRIYSILADTTASDEVLVCRLVQGKITLVHRRLWPALVRLAARFAPEQLAQVVEEHTPSGRHAGREIPFPHWVPADVETRARAMSEAEAEAALGAWASPVGTSRRAR